MKNRLFILGFLLIFVLFVSGCTEKEDIYSHQEATQLSKLVMEGAPMYKFDGFDLALVKTTDLGNSTWQFDYLFKCKNEGYGDRANQKVKYQTTKHNSSLVVYNGTVVYAVVDNKWDILNREFLN